MGLDMHLNAERYLWSSDAPDGALKQKIAALLGTPGKMEVTGITCEAMYWRKANAIHNWFVKNVQGGVDECQRADVSKEQLGELVDLCKQVLANKELAKELLPTQAGFFFGNTEFDDWYFESLENTVAGIEPLLSDEYTQWDFYYRSSW